MLGFSVNLFEKRISSALSAPDVFPPILDNNGSQQSSAIHQQNYLNTILHLPNDRDFLEAAYRLVLGRACDPIGLARYMEALHNQVPRQTVLRELSNSKEASKTRPGTDARRQTVSARLHFLVQRHVLGPLRQLLRRVLLARFDSIDYQLNFVLEELSRRNDILSRKLDDTGVALSQRLDTMGEELHLHRTQSPELSARLISLAATSASHQELFIDYCERLTAQSGTIIGNNERHIIKLETLLAGYQKDLIGYCERIDARSAARIGGMEQIIQKWEAASVSRQESLVGHCGRIEAQSETLIGDLERIIEKTETLITNSRMLGAQGEVVKAAFEELIRRSESLDGKVQQLNYFQQEHVETVATVVERIAELHSRTEGLHRLNLELQERNYPFLVRVGQGLLVTKADGFLLGIPEEEWRLAAYFAFRGVPEPGPVALFKTLIRPGMTVLDIGANIGIYSLHAAQILGPEGHLHSFEPVPKIHQILRDNIQVNGFLETGSVQLHQLALSDWDGRSEFAVFPGNWGHSTLFPGDREADRITVDVRKLDDMLGDARVDVVKIDAEGAELNVLRGMRNVIARNPGIRILMEFGPSNLVRANIAPEDLLDWLEANDISYARVDDLSGQLRKTCQAELIAAFSTVLCLSRGMTDSEGEP